MIDFLGERAKVLLEVLNGDKHVTNAVIMSGQEFF